MKNYVETNKMMHNFMGRTYMAGRNDCSGLLKYHLSWDWLIPVYNKAILVIMNSPVLKEKLKDHNQFLTDWSVNHFFEISDVNRQVNIGSSYVKAADIVKWINENR